MLSAARVVACGMLVGLGLTGGGCGSGIVDGGRSGPRADASATAPDAAALPTDDAGAPRDDAGAPGDDAGAAGPRCGDGLKEATEACDGAELGGATCLTLG